MPAIIGYINVSLDNQSTESQREQLKEAGCQTVQIENRSRDSHVSRVKLQNIIDDMIAGDELVVITFDHLGNTVKSAINVVHDLYERGASLRVLNPPISTKGRLGKMMWEVVKAEARKNL